MILKSTLYNDVFLLESDLEDDNHSIEHVQITSSIPSMLTWDFDGIFRIFSVEEDSKYTILPTLGLRYVDIAYACPTRSHPSEVMAVDADTYTQLIMLFPQHRDFLRERLKSRVKTLSGL